MEKGLPKERRLRKRGEILSVLKKGKRIENDKIKIFYTEVREESKIGVSVKRKIVNSVKRNRIRRVLKEIFRKERENFKKRVNMMIIVKKDISGEEYKRVEKDFKKIIKKRGLI
jgi:ribonuclease P protein component